MRLAWITDPHLNFATYRKVLDFIDEVRATGCDGVVISGDIAESRDVVEYLERLDDAWQRPLYFVLGNHDFYHGSIAQIRRAMDELCAERPRLCYLTHRSFVPLTRQTALVGHDGWADARVGDYERSDVMLNDYRLIDELAWHDKASRLPVLRQLGDEAGEHLGRTLRAALDEHSSALVVTHVPPLREACWHEGRLSDDEWVPHFTCIAAGEAMLEVMRERPDRRLLVVCGHTHGGGSTRPLDNVEIHTGPADYGRPAIVRVLEVE